MASNLHGGSRNRPAVDAAQSRPTSESFLVASWTDRVQQPGTMGQLHVTFRGDVAPRRASTARGSCILDKTGLSADPFASATPVHLYLPHEIETRAAQRPRNRRPDYFSGSREFRDP